MTLDSNNPVDSARESFASQFAKKELEYFKYRLQLNEVSCKELDQIIQITIASKLEEIGARVISEDEPEFKSHANMTMLKMANEQVRYNNQLIKQQRQRLATEIKRLK